jgi:hypothetical protein
VEFPLPGNKGKRRKLLCGLSERGADQTMFMNEKEGRCGCGGQGPGGAFAGQHSLVRC